MARNNDGSGRMSVSEAGRRGGEKTKQERGPEFYHRIGQKGGKIGGKIGGHRVRDLVEKGKRSER